MDGTSSYYKTARIFATDGYWYSAMFQNVWFAEGTSRYAFRGILQSNGPNHGMAVVVKLFKAAVACNYRQWVPDIKASKKADAFAEQFNAVAKHHGIQGVGDITFRIPTILQISDVPHVTAVGLNVHVGEYVAVEPFIEGDYVKFNGNAGYEQPDLSQFLTAFCHWTWEVSGRKFMVCDLQGVRSSNGYQLTDPVIHSVDQIYGPTDLGVVGMEKVLTRHTCNYICGTLNLENPLRSLYRARYAKGTSYSFQLTAVEQLTNRMKKPRFQFKPTRLNIAE